MDKIKFIKKLLWKLCEKKELVFITNSLDRSPTIRFGDIDNHVDTYISHYIGQNTPRVYVSLENLTFRIKRKIPEVKESFNRTAGILSLSKEDLEKCEIRWVSENNFTLVFPNIVIIKYRMWK